MRIASTVLLILILTSCNNEEKFNSELWNQGGVDWQVTETRENMVADLIASDTLIGLEKLDVVQLIGKPEFEESNKLKVLIREKYSGNIDPDYISYLIIDFDKEGKAINCYVEK